MLSFPEHYKTLFTFGSSTVRIRYGDLLNWVEDDCPDAIISTEDNYLTMQRGVSHSLCELLGSDYAQEVMKQSPTKPGSVFETNLHELNIRNSLVVDVSKPGQHPETSKAPMAEEGVRSCPIPRHVLHAVVLDYDGGEESLEALVAKTALACLELADELGLETISLPAMGVGSGGLTMGICARVVCTAIKRFLAQERGVKGITIVLYQPTYLQSADLNALRPRMNDFVREANAILDSPYDPRESIRQARDFYGREDVIDSLIRFSQGEVDGKRHVLCLGGPSIGKFTVFEQYFYRQRLTYSDASPQNGKFIARVSFSEKLPKQHPNFIFRKLLLAMLRDEEDQEYRRQLRQAYGNQRMNASRFLVFLDQHAAKYGEVIFLVDRLPVSSLDDEEGKEKPGDEQDAVNVFYQSLDRLQARVRFFFTLADHDDYEKLKEKLDRYAPEFLKQLEVRWLRSLTQKERSNWVSAIYRRYLSTNGEVPLDLFRFVEEEAGAHPFLVSLVCFLLIGRMKRVCLSKPEYMANGWPRVVLSGVFDLVRNDMVAPRKEFFTRLVDALPPHAAVDIFNLARAVMLDEQKRLLGSSLAAGDPNAHRQLVTLLAQGNPRENLHPEILDWLVDYGYVVREEQGKENLVVLALAPFLLEKMGGFRKQEDRPSDVTISILATFTQKRLGSINIRTLFNSQGARVISADKQMSKALRKTFLNQFEQLIDAPHQQTAPGGFHNIEEVANFILSQFTTQAVKGYLENPPPDCTIYFLIDDLLKEIPWELMLEAAYAGEIPFRVGRSIISNQNLGNIRPVVRGPGRIKALLIGNPTGDLPESELEVANLASVLAGSSYFVEPDILLGRDQCKWLQILSALSSGKYGLVHYSGHSRLSGTKSAWIVSDGKITTDQLTNAVQSAPPVLVYSSSCWSSTGGKTGSIRYENQAFDLPGAFLTAGVEAYIGTLWPVESVAARRITERFYTALLSNNHPIGECLRKARQSLKFEQERAGALDWLAFILYGDPHRQPADLYPGFSR